MTTIDSGQWAKIPMRRRLIFPVALAIALVVTGCWDRLEIEQHAFVLGVGIDAAQTATSQVSQSGPLRMTLEIARPDLLGGGGGGQSGGGKSQQRATVVPTTTGEAVADMVRNFAARLNRRVFFGHLKVIVIGEELAKKGIQEPIDFFARDPEMQRRMKMFVSQGPGREILEKPPVLSDTSSLYLSEMLETNIRETGHFWDVDLGELLVALSGRGGFLLPRVARGTDDLKVAGAAVFRGDQMVGWLSERETEGALWLMGELRGTKLVVEMEGGPLVFDVRTAESRVRVKERGGKLYFTVAITVEGDVIESEGPQIILDVKVIQSIEKLVADRIQATAEAALQRAQVVYRTDFLDYGKFVARREPQVWARVKMDWNEACAQSEVTLQPNDVSVRRLGLIQ